MVGRSTVWRRLVCCSKASIPQQTHREFPNGVAYRAIDEERRAMNQALPITFCAGTFPDLKMSLSLVLSKLYRYRCIRFVLAFVLA